MKKYLSLMLLASISLSSTLALSAERKEENVLNVYNWPDYIAPDTIANFEKETGIKVNYKNYDSNEDLYAILKTKPSNYDIVVPSSNWAKQQIDAGLLQKLDKSQIPNLVNIDESINDLLSIADPGNDHLVDWMYSYTTVNVNVEKVTKALGNDIPKNVWDLVFNPTYTKRLKSCGISYTDSASDIYPAALMYMKKDPYSNNAEDYEIVNEMLSSVRPDIRKFEGVGQKESFEKGETCVSIGWAGDVSQARFNKIKTMNIAPLIPSTGAFIFMDTMAIPVNAKHVSNAHKFINYILKPEVSASISNHVRYATPNKNVEKYIDQKLFSDKSVFLNKGTFKKLIPPGNVNAETSKVIEASFDKFMK